MAGRIDTIIGFDFLHIRKYYSVAEAQLVVAVGFYRNFVMFGGNCSLLAVGKVNFEPAESGFDVLRKGGTLPDCF